MQRTWERTWIVLNSSLKNFNFIFLIQLSQILGIPILISGQQYLWISWASTKQKHYVDFVSTTKSLDIHMIWISWAPPHHNKSQLCGFRGTHQTIKYPNDMGYMGTTKPQKNQIMWIFTTASNNFRQKKKEKKEIWMLTNTSLQGTMICPWKNRHRKWWTTKI